MGKNDFLARQRQTNLMMLEAGVKCGRQQMCDMITLALRDPEIMGKDTFGAKRLIAVLKKTANLLDDYDDAWHKCDDSDYYQEVLDRNLREAYGDEIRFFTFRERYDMLKRFNYKTGRWE